MHENNEYVSKVESARILHTIKLMKHSSREHQQLSQVFMMVTKSIHNDRVGICQFPNHLT